MRQLSIIAHDNNAESSYQSHHNHKTNNSSPIHRNPIETIHYNSIDEAEIAKINNANRKSSFNNEKQINRKN